MAASLWLGLLLTLAAGILSGNCMLPMKFVRRWRWENTWFVFSLVSLVLLPWALAFAEVSGLGAVYAALPASAFIAPLLFGAGWGIAQVLFGLAISRLGLALGYAIIVGLGAVLGTLVPLFVNTSEVARTARGGLIMAGLLIMVAGIMVCAWAGQQREKPDMPTRQRRYGPSLALAVLCGLMAPMLNYAFAFGQAIAKESVRQGTPPQAAGYAVWPIALSGGLIPNIAYSVYLLQRNRTWKYFSGKIQPDLWLSTLMGGLWMAAFALYGVSSAYLGKLGTSAGWAIFQIFMILTANLSGVLTGEWKAAPRYAQRALNAGLFLLAAATALIAAGNR
jgi:L-rhamnose-H+ transport protein